MLAERQLSAGHARAIAGLKGESLQIEAAAKAVKNAWSVRQIENYTGSKTSSAKKAAGRKKAKSQDIRRIEERLSEAIGTKVLINGSEKRGRLELEYYSRDELERLLELLLNA